jgi:hypothetical protein
VLEDHVEGELEKSVKAESELNERMGNYELASENMKKDLVGQRSDRIRQDVGCALRH